VFDKSFVGIFLSINFIRLPKVHVILYLFHAVLMRFLLGLSDTKWPFR